MLGVPSRTTTHKNSHNPSAGGGQANFIRTSVNPKSMSVLTQKSSFPSWALTLLVPTALSCGSFIVSRGGTLSVDSSDE